MARAHPDVAVSGSGGASSSAQPAAMLAAAAPLFAPSWTPPTQFGLTVKAVQCDNGREFDNSISHSFFLSQGVQLRMSCPYTSPQNGKAERMIRTTNDVVRTLLIQASLPHASGLRASTPPPTCSTAFRPLLLLLPLHTTLFSVPLLATTTFGSSGVRVTLTPPPPLLTSWRPARLVVCSSGTPLTTRGTDALTSPLAAF